MPTLGPTEVIIIAIVVLVLFGAKKMPDAARSLGRSMRIFKAETKTLRDDDDDKSSTEQSQQSPQSSSAQPEQGSSSAQPQQLSSAQREEPVVDGKVVSREQAEQSR